MAYLSLVVLRLVAILPLLFATAIHAAAGEPAAVGICLVALTPASPDQEVGGVPYCAYARSCCSYILRTPQGMKVDVADERFRGMVILPTRSRMHAYGPENELARIEAVAKRYPLAAHAFATKLSELRQLVENRRAAGLKDAAPPAPPAPPFRLAGRDFHDFQLRTIAEGRAHFTHRDGAASLLLESLTDDERKLLTKLAAELRKPLAPQD